MLQTKIIDNNSIIRADDDDDDDDDNGTKVTIVEVVGCAAVLETITILVRFILLICITSIIVLRNVDTLFNDQRCYSWKNKSNDDLSYLYISYIVRSADAKIEVRVNEEWITASSLTSLMMKNEETKKLLLMPVNLLAFFFVKEEKCIDLPRLVL